MNGVAAVLFFLAALAPSPKHLEQGKGFFPLSRPVSLVLSNNSDSFLDAQARRVQQQTGLSLVPACRVNGHSPAIILGFPANNNVFASPKIRRLLPGVLPAQEGFSLVITPSLLVVAGGDKRGLQYGIDTLVQWMKRAPGRASASGFPAVRIQDYPSLPFRGVLTTGPLSDEQLKKLVRLRCNLLAISSQEFFDLSRAETDWRTFFKQVQQWEICPVPCLCRDDFKKFKADLARPIPVFVSEPLTLSGDDWFLLAGFPGGGIDSITVTLPDGTTAVCNKDFALSEAEGTGHRLCMIRRLEGGRIADGGSVTVRYIQGYTVNPKSKQVTDFADMALTVQRQLHATWIMLKGADQSVVKCLLDKQVNVLVSEESAGNTRRYRWYPAVMAGRREETGKSEQRKTPVARNPKIIYQRTQKRQATQVKQPADAALREASYFLTAPNVFTPDKAYAFCRDAINNSSVSGVLFPLTLSGKTLETGLVKAWSGPAWRDVWLEVLDPCWRVSLVSPGYDQVLDTLVMVCNAHILDGGTPETAFPVLKNLEKNFGKTPQVKQVCALAKNLVRWLQLEAQYHQEPGENSVLRGVLELIRKQASLDPHCSEERLAGMMAPVQTRGLFIPSSILFRRSVLPWRPMDIPEGWMLAEIIHSPRFEDYPGEEKAFFDFPAIPGPIARIDFETVNTREITLLSGEDRDTLSPVLRQTANDGRSLSGPLVLPEPFMAKMMCLSVKSWGDTAVLRTIRIFALKSPASVVAIRTPHPPVDMDFPHGTDWPHSPQVRGFLLDGERNAFARAQSSVRVLYDESALYFGAYLYDSRMKTRLARLRTHDSPLEQEESFGITLQNRKNTVFHFRVNPLGTRSESRNEDSQWSPEWTAVTRDYADGWAAIITLPLNILEDRPSSLSHWKINFHRTRRNVITEHSSWAPAPSSNAPSGLLLFY